MWSWLKGAHAVPPSPALSSPPQTAQNAHTHCDDCEFSFFNHAGTLPFDQLDECQCATHHTQDPEQGDA